MTDSGELVEFSIVLSGTYWDRRPEFDIILDGTVIESGTINQPPSTVGLPNQPVMSEERNLQTLQVINFSRHVSNGKHCLSIRLKNKLPSDTNGFREDGTWARDMLLNVEKITVDGIDLSYVLFQQAKFVTDSGNTLTQCLSLGHNGALHLEFTSPLYIWLLEYL